tara:strand:- start:13489 stop:14463 length:975 start_codon:yes stop_codon:yes gene_type:complete
MHIALCIRDYTKIRNILEDELPDDEIVEYSPSEVSSAATNADVLIPIVAPVTAKDLKGSKVKLIQQFGAGLDSVDIPAASDAKIFVSNVPSLGTGNAESVAELAIAFMISLARHLPLATSRFKEGKFGAPIGQSLWQSSVAILGYGSIGQEINRRLQSFGMDVTALSKHGPDGPRKRDETVPVQKHLPIEYFQDGIKNADFVVVTAPGGPENNGLVDSNFISKMKKGSYLINVARGSVVEYQALLAGLVSQQLAGAGLDVFWHEPFDPSDPIMNYNVIATPHIGGATDRSLRGIGGSVAANIKLVKMGTTPLNCANLDEVTGVG